MTALDLRRAATGYPESVVCAVVQVALRECPVAEAAGDPDFAGLVAFWLTDPSAVEHLPPPLPAATVDAIARRLKAAIN
jgi:hypothetical protein